MRAFGAHRGHYCSDDVLLGSAPSRVAGAKDSVLLVHEGDGRAVGGERGQCDIAAPSHLTVGFFILQRSKPFGEGVFVLKGGYLQHLVKVKDAH